MTREEFAKGWVFLTVQPWGKRYAGTDGAAMVQSELYYNKFCNQNGYVWQGVCEILAEGDHWPNVGELRHAIQHNTPQVKPVALPLNTAADDFYPKQVVMAWKNIRDNTSLLTIAEQYLQPFLDNPKYRKDEKEMAIEYCARLKAKEQP